jgi:hypothetical protein
MDFPGYLAALLTNWVALMSGIASIILTVIGFYRTTSKAWYWAAALVCFFIASEKVCNYEH